jgi:hypothetical protein
VRRRTYTYIIRNNIVTIIYYDEIRDLHGVHVTGQKHVMRYTTPVLLLLLLLLHRLWCIDFGVNGADAAAGVDAKRRAATVRAVYAI